jgi:LacI family transcriptional regulator
VAGALRGSPFHLNITPYFPSEDPMKPIRYIVETGSADAVIFNQIEPRDVRVEWLMERGFPFATHGRSQWSDRHAWFDFDNAVWAAVGVRRLARAGRRQVMLIAPPLSQNYAQNILSGVRAAQAETGVTVTVLTGATSDSAGAEVQAAVRAHLASHPGTDAFICSSTSATMAAVAALESTGRAVGRDVDVFAKEAIPFLTLFRPGIIAMREDVSRAGDFLAHAAIRAAREPGAPPMQGLDVPQDGA